jgi:predicted phage-related endonuclease
VKSQSLTRNFESRRHFVGGSDARIIMGPDEAALIRLWREKRGESEPDDLSDNLIVQLGLATEALNRSWLRAKHRARRHQRSVLGAPPCAPLDGSDAGRLYRRRRRRV